MVDRHVELLASHPVPPRRLVCLKIGRQIKSNQPSLPPFRYLLFFFFFETLYNHELVGEHAPEH